MNKDKDLEELFAAHRPTFDDGDAFMQRLNRRLDAVEYLRQYEEANLRRYRCGMVAALVLGVVMGGVLMVVSLTMPADVPLFTFTVKSELLSLIGQHSRFIAICLLSLLMSFGIISTLMIMQSLSQLRDRRDIKARALN